MHNNIFFNCIARIRIINISMQLADSYTHASRIENALIVRAFHQRERERERGEKDRSNNLVHVARYREHPSRYRSLVDLAC